MYLFVINENDFRNTFLRNYESQKAETWYKRETMSGCMCLPKLGPGAHDSQSFVS